jgi:hypothetical protein
MPDRQPRAAGEHRSRLASHDGESTRAGMGARRAAVPRQGAGRDDQAIISDDSAVQMAGELAQQPD